MPVPQPRQALLKIPAVLRRERAAAVFEKWFVLNDAIPVRPPV